MLGTAYSMTMGLSLSRALLRASTAPTDTEKLEHALGADYLIKLSARTRNGAAWCARPSNSGNETSQRIIVVSKPPKWGPDDPLHKVQVRPQIRHDQE